MVVTHRPDKEGPYKESLTHLGITSVVLALLAELTAVLPNDAATGMEWKKEPTKLDMPWAMNSWVASTSLPCAKNKILKKTFFFFWNISFYFQKNVRYLNIAFNLSSLLQ